MAFAVLTGIAALQAKHGEIEQALELLFIILAHPASVQDTKNYAEQLCNELEVQLPKQLAEAVQTRAQTLPFETVVNEVLKQTKLT